MSTQKAFQGQIAVLKHKKFLFTFLIFLLIAAMIWVMVSLFTSQNKLKISTDLKVMSKPLTPNLDLAVFDQLQEKQFYSDDQLKEFPIYYIYRSKDGRENKIMQIGTQVEVSPTPKPQISPTLSPKPASSSAQVDS